MNMVNPFSLLELMNLKEESFKILSWLAGALNSTRSSESSVDEVFGTKPQYLDGFRISLEDSRYEKITGLPVENLWMDFSVLKEELVNRGYLSECLGAHYGAKYRERYLLIGERKSINDEMFSELEPCLIRARNERSKLMQSEPSGQLRFDAVNCVLHRDGYDKVLFYTNRSNGKVIPVLKMLFSPSYRPNTNIKCEELGMEARQLYKAVHDINAQTKKELGLIEDFLITSPNGESVRRVL